MRARLLAAAISALVIGPVPLGEAPSAVAAREAEPVRVKQFNFCGVICNDGVIDKPGRNNDVVEDIRNLVLETEPHLVMLHEACADQVDRLIDLLEDSDWEMEGVFRAQRQDRDCRGDLGFGDAVLTAGRVGDTEVLDLPDTRKSKEDRAILCLETDAEGPVLACALHLVTGKKGKAERYRQLDSAADMLNERAGDGAVIVGGDFNTKPDGMDAFLADDEGGEFFDIDPEKAATRGQKIDYVLFSRDDFSDPEGGPVTSKFSDHRALIGQAVRD